MFGTQNRGSCELNRWMSAGSGLRGWRYMTSSDCVSPPGGQPSSVSTFSYIGLQCIVISHDQQETITA